MYYPKIYFLSNNATIIHKQSSLLISNSKLEIIKSYWPYSPFYININSPLINLNGIEVKNSFIKAKYTNKILTFDNLKGSLVDGSFNTSGKINFNNKNYFNIKGSFKNISLNTILNQANIATWERLTVKLSSNSFNIIGHAKNKHDIVKSLNGKVKISGSAYLLTSEEERFGSALLSLLVEKLPIFISVILPAKSSAFNIILLYVFVGNSPKFISICSEPNALRLLYSSTE